MPKPRITLRHPSLAIRLLVGMVICMALMAMEWAQRSSVAAVQAVAHVRQAIISLPAPNLLRRSQGHIPMPANTPAAHASSLVAMPKHHAAALTAFWFAGSRESGADVQIAASQFDRASQQWLPARFVVNRSQLAEQLGFAVRRLGNPVAWVDAQDRLHLFVVATGLGGWAASRIVHMRQSDDGHDFQQLAFEAVRVLPLSWLWNTSFLVRAAPLPLTDGGMVLPVHFELGLKYPVALRFDAQGEMLGMARISSQKHLLQPTLVPLSATHWLALMRSQHADGKLGVAHTLDAGQHWVDLPNLTLDNPDASVAALALGPGALVLAHNSSPRSRQWLDLSASDYGLNWTLAQPLARGGSGDEFSYPALAWADDSLWVSYTDQRRRIAWQRFDTVR